MEHRIFNELTASEAVTISRISRKPLFIDFWATGCKGCEKMDETTYRDQKAIDALDDFILVKYHSRNMQKNFRNCSLRLELDGHLPFSSFHLMGRF